MTIVVTIQDNVYLCWQAELLAWNVRRLGGEIIVLCGYRGRPSSAACDLERHCEVRMMEDFRSDTSYAPSIQPHLLSRYRPPGGPLLLVDSDVLFKTLANLPVTDGRTVYASDCGSYLNAAYVDGCDPHLLHHLCTISHIPPDRVRGRRQAPGAQYILPHGFDAEFWRRIEHNCNAMYRMMVGYRCAKHPVQVWTASMWAIWFELLRLEMAEEIDVVTHRALDFAWAPDPIAYWSRCDILHMAGVTRGTQGHFFKGDYTETKPWHCALDHVRPDNCSWIYKEAVVEYGRLTGG